MKKKKGYISIIALIVMSISIVMILDVIFLSNQQNLMMNSRGNNIQSYYLSEGKILMSLYVDKYYNDQLYPAVLDVFRKHNFAIKSKRIIMDKSDLEDEDNISDVKLAFEDRKNRKELVLKAQSDYKGIRTSVKASTTLVNDLFEIEESILSMDNMEDKYKYDLERLLTNMEENITARNIDKLETLYAKEISSYNRISLKKIDKTNYNLICTREAMEHPYIEGFNKREVFIVVKGYEDNKTTFHIDCIDKTIDLKGIIYVEGDLKISGEFSFQGIIIVNNGEIKINSEIKPKINGMMILYDNENITKVNEEMNLQYDNFTVYKYGTFIPGFLDINLKLMKNGE